MTPGLLIVGGGLAAQGCCETLRALGHDAPITIVGPERPYDRPPLSKERLAEPPWLRPLEWYAAHDVRLRPGVAVRLDTGRRVLALADGERLRYGELLIATGSEPVRLPALAGFENVQALRTFADAARLRAALAAGARLTVVGGGLIGLEVASSARRHGAEVTVIEVAPSLLPRLGLKVGAHLAASIVRTAWRFISAPVGLRSVGERRAVTALPSSSWRTGRGSRPIMSSRRSGSGPLPRGSPAPRSTTTCTSRAT